MAENRSHGREVVTIGGDARVQFGHQIAEQNNDCIIVKGNTFVYSAKEKDSQTVYNWFSGIPYWSHHTTMSKDLLSGSGQWLLERSEFKEWESTDASVIGSSVLWIRGIPGSGKTMLIASVINRLESLLEGSSHFQRSNFAYFYCLRSTSERERSDPDQVLRSILRQLAFEDDLMEEGGADSATGGPDDNKMKMRMKHAVALAYQKKEQRAKKARHEMEEFSADEIVQLLAEVCKGTFTTIVIDAFDELDRVKRGFLFEAFDTINSSLKRSGKGGTVRLLISSREDQDIVMKMKSLRNVYISVDQNRLDVQRFIDQELGRVIDNGLLLKGNIPKDFQEEINNTLFMKANGMFRWVSLQISWLCGSASRKVVKRRLNELPKDLQDSYQLIWQQVLELDPEDVETAYRIISLILCAKRPVQCHELLDAIMCNTNDMPLSEEDFVSSEDVLHICQNLVVLDNELGVFRVAHLSVREFFEQRQEFTKPKTHGKVLDMCLSALIWYAEHNLERNSVGLRGAAYKDYAVRYWALHFEGLGYQGPEEEMQTKIKKFLFGGNIKSAAFLWWAEEVKRWIAELEREDRHEEWKINCSRSMFENVPAFIACARGAQWLLKIEPVARYLGPEVTNGVGGDCNLIIAAHFGHTPIVADLLQQNIPVDTRGLYARTALKVAAEFGDMATVQLLLEKGANPNVQDYKGNTPLHAAANGNRPQVAKLLLDGGAIIELPNNIGETPLFYAVRCSFEVTKLLLKNNANVMARANKDDTPLHAAVWAFSDNPLNINLSNTVKLMLDQDVDLLAKRIDGNTPFHWATRSEVCLQLFLSRLAPNDMRQPGMVFQAVLGQSPEALQILLEQGADINVTSYGGKMALDYALERSSAKFLEVLLKYTPKAGLQWDLDSIYVLRWKSMPWYPSLKTALDSSTISSATADGLIHISTVNSNLRSFFEKDENVVCLGLEVPTTMTCVQTLHFQIESRDQGWSDGAAQWGGTYMGSNSWFEVCVKPAVSSSTSAREHLQSNVHASKDWHLHRLVWTVEDPSRSDFFADLHPGCTIQVFARAQFKGWANHVKSVQVDMYGIHESPRPSLVAGWFNYWK